MSKLKKKKLQFIFTATVVAAALAIYLLVKYASEPQSVAVSQKSESAKTLSYSLDLSPVNIANSYVSFNYPRALALKNTALVNVRSVASYNFYVKDVYSWILAIDIENRPLSQDSSYILRQQDPSVYGQATQTINGQPVTIFTDNSFTNGFSETAFLVHGSLIASVSLVGGDASGNAPLIATFNMVLKSWQWRDN